MLRPTRSPGHSLYLSGDSTLRQDGTHSQRQVKTSPPPPPPPCASLTFHSPKAIDIQCHTVLRHHPHHLVLPCPLAPSPSPGATLSSGIIPTFWCHPVLQCHHLVPPAPLCCSPESWPLLPCVLPTAHLSPARWPPPGAPADSAATPGECHRGSQSQTMGCCPLPPQRSICRRGAINQTEDPL